jgi:hypothetical protein
MSDTTGPGRVVEFRSGEATLRGRLFEHAGPRRPIVVMAHGFSATITGMVADRYAEAIHDAGMNVLLYDHEGFGLSGGELRQRINRWTQIRGYRDAIGFAAGLPSTDGGRVAVWGDSFCAAVAIGVAAFDSRVRAVVVQVPACGSALPPADPDGTLFRTLRGWYADGPPADAPVTASEPMAVVSPDQLHAPSLLEPITAFRWFIDYGGRPGTGWLNWAVYEFVETPVLFHAGLCAPNLTCPSWWGIADDDEMAGAEPAVAIAAFDAAPQPKERMVLDGGHFGLLYHPSPLFDRIAASQIEFLARHL